MSRPFRFGVVAAPQGPGEAWAARARRVADLGYSTLLAPDNLHLHAPLPALATAAAAAPGLRVCPFVLAGPLRTPRATAWEAHTMTALTGGRFDLGLGTGRPAARAEAEALGMPWGTAAERLAQVRAAIAALRELDGRAETPVHTPVLMAASGPRALGLAAEVADIVTLAAQPTTPRPEVKRMAGDLRARAAGRDLEIGMNVFVVGDEIPDWAVRWAGPGAAEALRDPDTLAVLRGTPDEMAAELDRRRAELGVSYLAVSEPFAEALAPVVERLTGN
ncbi:LLM class flavin-dependent oxidoreductase [Pseudonocardia halophobica]|uniref:N5,N10-methylene tetrahydromethanopterin reductase n=1 Tax=Pseudonocardia halophobica TaxID=29401 RepID=A0A9W6UEX1_9PSEU|nr:LLM class flavin-dependent oxidoreductase [Pseudonocardia halophobica]GLL15338.1 N5,N10-methylene tetrahydromethanopterin reductase [Pseudonocardia halophobica]